MGARRSRRGLSRSWYVACPTAGRVLAAALAAVCWTMLAMWPAGVAAQPQGNWNAAPINVQPNGLTMRVPLNRPISRRSGLSLTIDTRWANNYGYRPVEVTVTSPKPTTADHLITIRVHTGWWNWQGGSISVEQDFELPLGKTSATTTIACPQYQLAMQFIWWEVWVDGVKDKDLSLDETTAKSVGIAPGSVGGISFLAVGPTNRQRLLMSPNSQEFQVLSLAVGEFPERWIDYTCFDVVTLSTTELQLVSQTKPAALEALRRWVRAGGQIWVSDVGDRWEQIQDVAKLFGLPDMPVTVADDGATDSTGNDSAVPVPPAGWQPVRFRDGNPVGQVVTFLNVDTGATRVERDPEIIQRLQNDPRYAIAQQQFEAQITEEAGDEQPRRRWPADSSRWFVERRLGLGAVRAFRASKDAAMFGQGLPGISLNVAGGVPESMGMNALAIAAMSLNQDGSERMRPSLAIALRSTRRWESRHGMTPDDANRDFSNLLVPGVGLAPVTEFRVLITLFVLLIGPGNYWLLKRVGRLYLLVLTVPLAALLMTATLFAYALVADGFSTTIRAHSYTTLDQRTGEAACWARLSYYSGLAPGRGLTMPSDVVVYPIIPDWNESSVGAHVGVAREVLWEASDARLTRGWLRSRTPTQYLTIRARQSPQRLELLPAAGKMRATNRLGAKIAFVVVIDQAGKLFVGENLAAGAKADLQPIARSDAIRRLRQLIMDHQPETPAALAAEDSDFVIMQRRQTRQTMRRRYGLAYSEENLSANLMSDALADLTGLAGRPALQLPPRSYVAVTVTGAEVVLGMAGAHEDASFHVIVGQW